ncbi:MAG: symmetrical bis(5'-nucleosyl)-tetraphosphatase [Buchnera aphidicola (Brevicoryne brassicae)]|uniref:Bis(5'-nucleosyl)-tetraphosphatase, symmetrical n=1 Tax=Buchnera aphidicola (Brevicoryne brassicae) TaxID=911343 RepID=A0AAJ5PUS9_9GAMM|nr:symmetrical bis(5'-nucleosyl)-tetraphosphatase [Buchnera aphidicola]QCI19720.1 symmetrical bis(5'-nucleosyl)-tetraphosphatase [Buchnera aphidicola (Brevicoryne brassicae)]WAI19091.1 MAG: symmetrical bis(5'-nucleosyl)-tetraphosphatase [Buchnera aphidicola (Brevicoryne brassicae)]
MSTYFTSDIHGCYKEFKLLLEKSSFNCKKDYLWVAGDLVSRGPDSLKVLRYLYSLSLNNRVQIVLGNHDLNLIAVHAGVKNNKKENFFDELLSSYDSDELINWLRHQNLLKVDQNRKIIMSHAGISPQWDISTAKTYALKIKEFLSHNSYSLFLESMYNNKVVFWDVNLNGLDKLRYSMNAFTRMRYCYPNGRLNMFYKQSPNLVKYPLQPWFFMKHNIPKDYSVFFGHWSNLKGIYIPEPFVSLDSGCCWGEEIILFRWEDKKIFSQKFLS